MSYGFPCQDLRKKLNTFCRDFHWIPLLFRIDLARIGLWGWDRGRVFHWVLGDAKTSVRKLSLYCFLGWLQVSGWQLEFILSWFWKSDVWNQDAGRYYSFWKCWGRIYSLVFSYLLRVAGNLGIAWFVDTLLLSLPPSLNRTLPECLCSGLSLLTTMSVTG